MNYIENIKVFIIIIILGNYTNQNLKKKILYLYCYYLYRPHTVHERYENIIKYQYFMSFNLYFELKKVSLVKKLLARGLAGSTRYTVYAYYSL